MQNGKVVFTGMDRVIFGEAAPEALLAETLRLDAKRVFFLVSGTLNRDTDLVDTMASALGRRYAGRWDHMPSHSPRDAVVRCANAARKAECDLLVTFGGGSATDGGKAVTICLEHEINEPEGLEPFRTKVDENGKRHFPQYRAPRVRQIVIPTTLSGGEFNARAGVTNSVEKLKQSFIHPGIIPISVILDPAVTVFTPEWLWLSTGVRAIDHAVETFCSLDANDYTDGAALQALRLLSEGLPRVKSQPDDLDARLKCLMGAWISMTGIVTGTRLGASHAIGHILGGTANVPHGYTSCVMLPYVLNYNSAINSNRQTRIAEALGKPNKSAGDALDELISALGMPRTLREVNIKEEQLALLSQNCMLDDWTFSNPREIRSPDQIMEILQAAF